MTRDQGSPPEPQPATPIVIDDTDDIFVRPSTPTWEVSRIEWLSQSDSGRIAPSREPKGHPTQGPPNRSARTAPRSPTLTARRNSRGCTRRRSGSQSSTATRDQLRLSGRSSDAERGGDASQGAEPIEQPVTEDVTKPSEQRAEGQGDGLEGETEATSRRVHRSSSIAAASHRTHDPDPEPATTSGSPAEGYPHADVATQSKPDED